MKAKKEIYWYVEPLNEGQSMNYVETFYDKLTASRRACLMLRQLKSSLVKASISVQVHCADGNSEVFYVLNNSIKSEKLISVV